jgi:hypothetical protein
MCIYANKGAKLQKQKTEAMLKSNINPNMPFAFYDV